MTAYYNENDAGAASWLRELIREGHIARGHVDQRSIWDVRPADLEGFTQCHFFAGIGGWSYALKLAGWPDEAPVWTGSCPCQPFSAAGKRAGFTDDRHLWPAFAWLITERRPAIIFGEQVAGRAGLEWLDLVSTDLERARYAVGAADLCAAGIGAPHIRQRLYWVAHRDGERFPRLPPPPAVGPGVARGGADLNLGDADHPRREGPTGPECAGKWAPWASGIVVYGSDGRGRPVEPGTCPVADGVSGSVGLLRGYGNAIVPQLAALFIRCSAGAAVAPRLTP